MFRKILTLLLILFLSISLVGCDTKETNTKEIVGQITDGANRTVNIYADNKEATVASVYFVATPFFVALKMTDRVLAVNPRTSFWTDADEGLKQAGTVGKGNVDLEKLAQYNPTVLIHRSNDPETIEAVEKIGINTLCITVENADDVINTLTILGKYFAEEENASKAINWFNSKLDLIDSVVKQIPDEEKPTAILTGSKVSRVAGKDMLQSWMIEKAGGKVVVEEYANHNWVDIGLEKLFEYNPETIFLTSSAARDYDVSDLLSDKTYSSLKAINNNCVFEVPTKLDSWDMPGLSCVLGIMYMLHEMHPNYFSKEELEDQVDDYYRFMFGRCFDKELNLDWDNFK